MTVTQTTLYHHIRNKIKQATLLEYPYYHISLRGFFPTELYSHLLKYLPPAELYEPLSKTRTQFIFTPANQVKLELNSLITWMDVIKVLNEIGFAHMVFEKFAPGLRERFGESNSDYVFDTHYEMDIRLMRDLPGYGIDPHRDTMNKIITMQVYLPEDESNINIGTQMFITKDINAEDGVPAEEGTFVEVSRFPFVPNFAYGFVVQAGSEKNSWHGVEKLPLDFKGVRNSLLIMFRKVT